MAVLPELQQTTSKHATPADRREPQSRVLIRVISPPIEAVGGTSVGGPSEKGGACELAHDSNQNEPPGISLGQGLSGETAEDAP